jgi:hypothetical protein
MKNPWMKKNPLLSMWLSSANAALGWSRGRATAEAHRQMAAITSQATQQMIRFWTAALQSPPPRSKRKRR